MKSVRAGISATTGGEPIPHLIWNVGAAGRTAVIASLVGAISTLLPVESVPEIPTDANTHVFGDRATPPPRFCERCAHL
jgi:hypothetical protein